MEGPSRNPKPTEDIDANLPTSSGLDSQELPKYYYDLLNKRLISGEDELRSYLETSTVETTEIYDLRTLLRDESTEVPGFNYQRKPKRSKAELLKYGRWLVSVVGRPEGESERVLNQKNHTPG